MTRSLKKGPFVDHHLAAKADKAAVLSALTLAWKGVMAKKPARPRKSS